MQWKGKVQQSATNNNLVSLTDILATVADLIGEELPENAGQDSWSFLHSMLNTKAPTLRKNLISHSVAGEFAFRQGPWKLVFAHTDSIKAVKEGKTKQATQLYNLDNDWSETTDLSEAYPDNVKELRALLEKQIKEGRSTPGTVQKNDAEIIINSLPEKRWADIN